MHGKFAVDSVADQTACAEDGDGFFYQRRAVIKQMDVPVKIANALGLRRSRHKASQ